VSRLERSVDRRVWRKDGGLRTNRYGLIFVVRSHEAPPRVLYIGHVRRHAEEAARAHPGGGEWAKLGETPAAAARAAAEAQRQAAPPCCAACAVGKPCCRSAAAEASARSHEDPAVGARLGKLSARLQDLRRRWGRTT
jgi:hypothetical protein